MIYNLDRLFFYLLGKGVPWNHPNVTSYHQCFDCSSQPYVKALMILKILTFAIDREKLSYCLITFLYWLPFMVLQDTLHAIGRERQASVSPSYKHYDLPELSDRNSWWYNSGKNVIGIKKHYLIGFKTHFITWNLTLLKWVRTWY